jgi:hypothetical protein
MGRLGLRGPLGFPAPLSGFRAQLARVHTRLEARRGRHAGHGRRPLPAGARTPRSASSTGGAARTREVCDSCAA